MRPSWDTYFIELCNKIAKRGTCDRKQVGAVLVKDNRIVSTGYNGSFPGAEHCDNIGHLMEDGHCIRTIHGEINAICQAAQFGIPTKGCTLYCNTRPCLNCVKTIISAGIKEIIYEGSYGEIPNDRVTQIIKELSGSIKFKKY